MTKTCYQGWKEIKPWQLIAEIFSDPDLFDDIYNYFCKELLLRFDLVYYIEKEGIQKFELKLRTILQNTLDKITKLVKQLEVEEENENSNS